MRKLQRGFTLIEILIVLAIIGIIAGGLFVTIDPLEQMNKARDAGALSRAKELVDAADRYYASRYTEPTSCANLVTVGELKATNACNGPSGTANGIALAGSAGVYTASFTPLSKAYTAKCVAGTAACIVPTEFQ